MSERVGEALEAAGIEVWGKGGVAGTLEARRIFDMHIIPNANAVVTEEGLEAAEGALRACVADELEAVLGRVRNKNIPASELYSVLDEWLTKFFVAAPLAVIESLNITVVDEVVEITGESTVSTGDENGSWLEEFSLGDILFVKHKLRIKHREG